MSVIDVNDLRQKRAGLIDEARSVLNAAGEQPAADAVEKYEKIEADIEALNKRIALEERQLGLESGISGGPLKESPEPAGETRTGTQSPEYRAAVQEWMRLGESRMSSDARERLHEVRVLTVGVDADGGFTVDDEFNNTLQICLRNNNVMRQVATVVQTSSGTHNIRVSNSDSTAAYEGECATTPEGNGTFANVQLGAHKLAALCKISEELLMDSAFNLETFIAQDFGSVFGRVEEEKMTVGTGTGEPTGIVTAAVAAGDETTAAAAAAISFDDIFDLYYDVSRVYRNSSGAGWLANDQTIKALRKLVDGDDQYLWQASLTAGDPDTILGKPVLANDFVADIGTTNSSVVFGDLQQFWIADRGNTMFQRLDELFKGDGKVGFRAIRRNDSQLIPCSAVRVLTHP